MTALSADNAAIKGPLLGSNLTQVQTILDAEIMYAGGMQAVDYAGEVQMASDTLGLRVQGVCRAKVDNADDGETTQPPAVGIYRINNSSTSPVSTRMIGKPCYVEDDNTVAATSTNLVVAGLVHDVDDEGVWVDFRPESMAQARIMARNKVVEVADTTATLTAAQCFQGNVVIAADNASGVVLTPPAAVDGYRVGFQRTAATAAHDVSIQMPTGNTIRGSDAGKKVVNDTDAVSAILWLETTGDAAWVDGAPLAPDRAEWAVDNS